MVVSLAEQCVIIQHLFLYVEYNFLIVEWSLPMCFSSLDVLLCFVDLFSSAPFTFQPVPGLASIRDTAARLAADGRKTKRYILSISTSHCQNNVNWFKLPRLSCHHGQGRGPGWICLAEYEQDRLLIHATRRQRRILQSLSLARASKNAPTGTQISIPHHWRTHTRMHACTNTHTHTHIQPGMIDGKRHKGQQSAGLHLDRTRVLLHHLDLGDGADPNRSFPQPLHCNIQYRSANVLKG